MALGGRVLKKEWLFSAVVGVGRERKGGTGGQRYVGGQRSCNHYGQRVHWGQWRGGLGPGIFRVL